MVHPGGNLLRLVRGVAVLAAALVAAPPAHATAGVACRADDATLALDLGAAFGRAAGAGLPNFGAQLEIRLVQVPPELRVLRFAPNALRQSWWHHRTLNLQLHHEQERPYGYVDLIIETTRSGEEDRYAGHYLLSLAVASASGGIDPPLEFRGDVVCTTD